MTDEMRPPPFPRAKDEETEPGVGLIALKQENARLRWERDLARDELQDRPPRLPPLRKSRVKFVGKWAVIGALIGGAAPLLEHFVPKYAELIHEVARRLGP